MFFGYAFFLNLTSGISGGIIAFHDIRTVRPGCGVKEFWEEFSPSIPKENRWEFTLQPFGPTGAGIGVIRLA